MCNVAAGASSALSIAGAIAGTRANLAADEAAYQKDLIQNQIAIQRTQIEAQMRSLEAVNNYTQLQIAQQESNEQFASEKGKVARDAAQARSMAAVMAGESGATGNSQDRIMRTIAGNKLAAIESLSMSRSSAVGQAEFEKKAAYLGAQVAPALITQPGRPNKFLTIFSGITGAAGGVLKSTNEYTNVFRTKTPDTKAS
jgi:hypothetical protein